MVDKLEESLIRLFVLFVIVMSETGGSERKITGGFHVHMVTLIYPGTKWCGPGNIASNYSDLGVERDTDLCCREHDNCPEYMMAGQSKYGLTNTAHYVRLHCSCDRRLLECLKENVAKTHSNVSEKVGAIYFDKISTHCYAKDHPIIGCKEYYVKHSKRCRDYILDAEKPPLWQWFDDPSFLEN